MEHIDFWRIKILGTNNYKCFRRLKSFFRNNLYGNWRFKYSDWYNICCKKMLKTKRSAQLKNRISKKNFLS